MRSLQLRFFLVLLCGAGLFAMAAAGLAYHLGFDRAITNGRGTLEGLMLAVEKTAAIGAYTGDKVLLKEVVDGLGRNPLAASVEIRRSDGSLEVEHRAKVAPGAPSAASDMTVERRLSSPFDVDETVGVLRINVDMAHLRAEAQREAVTLAILIVAQTVAVAYLLFFVAAHFVSKPIVRLAGRLKEMQPGSAERLNTPKLHQNDEIGMLIRGANDLLSENQLALQNERELRVEVEKMEAQYRKIFDTSSAGIFVASAQGQLINSNPTALRMLDISMDELQRLKGRELVARMFRQPEQILQMMAASARQRETVAADLELCPQHGAARWVHCLMSVQPDPVGTSTARASDIATGLIEAVMYDITDRKVAETAVRHQAEHDSLTGLKNRAAGDEAIDRLIGDAAAAQMPISFLYIDLDGFKRVNDLMGHQAGDQVLVQCARRLRVAVRRSSDLICRIGGDEFLVVLYNVGPGDANLGQICADIVEALCTPIAVDDQGTVARIGASVGVACYPRHGHDRKTLLEAADAAMYEVKRTGKNSFALVLAPGATA